MGRRRANAFLRESVILFGFLNGLFVSLGVNPGATIFAVLGNVIESMAGANGTVRLALTWAPLVLLLGALYLIHKRAGWLGFVAVGLAFLAGLWLLPEPVTGVLLLVGALGLGYVASR